MKKSFAIIVAFALTVTAILTSCASSKGMNSSADNSNWANNSQNQQWNSEEYHEIVENSYNQSLEKPLSTFSIDVDTASYSNIRRFINNGELPVLDAVRIEEMINYFKYDYPKPQGDKPFAVYTEIAKCPWNNEHSILMVGLQGKEIDIEEMPPANLVFLLDTSGSMSDADKLPLLKQAFTLIVPNLREQDRISIVAYAGSAGVVLDSVCGSDKKKILNALDSLESGGSTAGGAGLELAYKLAAKNFFKNGNNRVILATDGDFNVGISSDEELVKLIEKKRDNGIYLSILGFGEGNLKDSKMESIADKGNGNYAYIDSLKEAQKVLVSQMGGTLFTIAKDVKIQIEFNPAKVREYRLIGYENRVMNSEDFDDDSKDAGELGSGHTVTALYEIVPAEGEVKQTDLRYQSVNVNTSDEWANVKLRYKLPDSDESLLIEQAIDGSSIRKNPSDNITFASAVAEFGLILRNSEYKGSATIDQVAASALISIGKDEEGYRAEFIDLVGKAKQLM